MWMRQALAFKRAAILKSRKRIWPVEASANSVPLSSLVNTSARRVLITRWAKAENPQSELIGSHPMSAGAIGKQIKVGSRLIVGNRIAPSCACHFYHVIFMGLTITP